MLDSSSISSDHPPSNRTSSICCPLHSTPIRVPFTHPPLLINLTADCDWRPHTRKALRRAGPSAKDQSLPASGLFLSFRETSFSMLSLFLVPSPRCHGGGRRPSRWTGPRRLQWESAKGDVQSVTASDSYTHRTRRPRTRRHDYQGPQSTASPPATKDQVR
jgi:hypothetical protein